MTAAFAPADIQGIIPPLVTPFDAQGRIDEAALRATARFMLDQGVHGLVVGGSSGEGYTLETDELQRSVQIALEEADGRVPVLAGIIANSTRNAIRRAQALVGSGISALQITPTHYIYKTDESSMLAHFEEIGRAVDVPILIYNVISWNYLTPTQLLRVMREVPRVVGVKQSAGDLKALADLMIGARPEDRIYAAVDSLLYPCVALGAHGLISMLTSAVPGPCVRLWEAVRAGDHAFGRSLHERLLPLWNAMYADNRVALCKHVLALQGVPTGETLRPIPPPSPAQRAALQAALGPVLEFAGRRAMA